MTYALGNVEEEERADPAFRIPPSGLRESLGPGDLAEIMLLSEDLADPAWVQVVDVIGPGIYSGIFESGEPVEFGAEHVADVLPREELPPRMGAVEPEPFEALRRPPSPRPPSPFEVLRRPPPPRPPSPFEVLHRPPGAPPPAPVTPPPAAATQPKEGFFERLFRRKPKVEVSPIPAAERRAPPAGPFPRLPPPPEILTPAPVEVPSPPIAPPATTGLVPGKQVPVPAPGPSALIVPESRAAAPLAPDAFTMLVPPGETPHPGTLLIPSAPELPATLTPNIFEILTPPGPGTLMPAPPTSAFDLLVPPGAGPTALGPLEVRPGGLSPFDLLVPEPGGAIAPFDPAALDPFTMVAPPRAVEPVFEGPLVPASGIPPGEQQWAGWGAPPIFRPEAAPAPEKKRKHWQPSKPPKVEWIKKGGKWKMPSPKDVVPWIEDAFDVEKIWDLIRNDRATEEFRQMVIEQEDTGESALIPFQTVAYYYNSDWAREAAEFFDIPPEVTQPWFDELDRLNEREEDPDEVEQELHEFFQDYYQVVEDAFDLIKPRDLPGRIVVEGMEDQIVLAYWEGLSKEEQQRVERERQLIREEEERKKEERKKALRRIWGKMPTVAELGPYIEDKFDIDALWKHIRKTRKTQAFKDQLDENGDAYIELEHVASEGPTFYDELGFYFSLPPEVLALYLDRKEPLEGLLWEEVLGEFLNRVSGAFEETKPRDIPGMISVAEPEGGRGRDLVYVEQVE